jgi:hypothetical protein
MANYNKPRGRRGRDRMIFGFATIKVHIDCQLVIDLVWFMVFNAATGRWFSPGPTVSSINKSDRHDMITEILLKVALNTITPKPRNTYCNDTALTLP